MSDNFEKRMELAKKKDLIINDDYTNYRKVLNLYKEGFFTLLNNTFNFSYIDEKIDKSNLLFTNIKLNEKYSSFISKYFRCLNQFYIEKLEEQYLNILIKKEKIDNEVLNIVGITYKEILKKDNVKTVTYNPPTLENIVENGTIVIELVYGKNSKELSKEEFLVNLRKQNEFLKQLISDLEKEMIEKTGLKTKIFLNKTTGDLK